MAGQLEIHVGPLTSFFGPAVRAAAVRDGAKPPDDDQVRARIEAWREWLGQGLVTSGHLRAAPHWDERDPLPPDRLRVPVDAVRALKLLVAHGERGRPPAELPPHPERDPAWVALAESDFADTPFDQVLVPEFWFPGDFGFTLACPWPDGHEVQAGSVGGLLDQLGRLRETYFGGTPFDVALWSAGAVSGRDLRALARHAVGALETLARRAIERGQPMLWAPPAEPS